MALTERDKPAYEFLSKFRMAKLSQINRVCYNHYMSCCHRMAKLADDKVIFKRKNPLEQGVLYGFEKINLRSLRNYFHTMAVNETYIAFLEHTEVQEVYVEKIYGKVQVDMYIKGIYNGEPYAYMVEVETDRNGGNPNYDKYNHFLISAWREFFDVKPVVLYVTNKKIDKVKIGYMYKVIDMKLNNFSEMLKGPCE